MIESFANSLNFNEAVALRGFYETPFFANKKTFFYPKDCDFGAIRLQESNLSRGLF